MLLSDLPWFADQMRRRALQDAIAEATSNYWSSRARVFAAVGTAECDEIARACRNHALLIVQTREQERCCIATPEELADLERLARAFNNLGRVVA